MAQITLDQVDKVFGRGVKAVNDLSLEIQDGEFMVLVGPSGRPDRARSGYRNLHFFDPDSGLAIGGMKIAASRSEERK